MDLLVAHDVGFPEIVCANNDSGPLQFFPALNEFSFGNCLHSLSVS
jgi:hypothetical protein